MPRVARVLVMLLFSACAPLAGSDGEDRRMLSDLEIVIRDDGPLASMASDRLVSRGPTSIVILETGLYRAEAPARIRIIRALEAIGSAEAVPILEHLSRRDPDNDVRARARRGLSTLVRR